MRQVLTFIAAILMSQVAMAADYYCVYSGGKLKDGTPVLVHSNIFTADKDKTAESLFEEALYQEHKLSPNYVFCSSGDPDRIQSGLDQKISFSKKNNHAIYSVSIGQPADATKVAKQNGNVYFWTCGYWTSRAISTAYYSQIGQVVDDPDEVYLKSAADMRAAWGDYLKQRYDVSIGKGGYCDGVLSEDEADAYRESSKKYYREQEKAKNIIQTDWKPTDLKKK